MNARLLSVCLTGAILIFVVELIRREKLTFKYAAPWLMAGLWALLLAVFPGLLFKLSGVFGFQVPSNFLFFVVLSCVVFMSLFLSIFLCQQNRRNDRIAQQLGLLGKKIKDLEEKGG